MNNLEKKYKTHKRLSSLVLWTTLQAIGKITIMDRLQTALQTCKIFYDDLTECDGVKIIVSIMNNLCSFLDREKQRILKHLYLFINQFIWTFD